MLPSTEKTAAVIAAMVIFALSRDGVWTIPLTQKVKAHSRATKPKHFMQHRRLSLSLTYKTCCCKKRWKDFFIIHQREPLQGFLCYLVTAKPAAGQHIANYRRTTLRGNNNHSVVCHCIISQHTLDADYHHVLRTDSEQTHLHSWTDNYSPQST